MISTLRSAMILTQADMGLIMRLCQWLSRNERPRQPLITTRAERIIKLAYKSADQLHQPPNLQHLAIALLSFNEGCAWNVMLRWPIDISALRKTVAAQEDSTPIDSVLNLAQKEQRGLGHGYLGTEHLFLALLNHPQTAVAQFLAQEGLTLARAREQVLKELDPNFTGE